MSEECAGGIVLGDNATVLMVRSRNSQAWLFPKGRKDPGETDEETAMREIAEETGVTALEYIDDLGTYTRPGSSDWPEKIIHMYLFSAEAEGTLKPSNADEIEKVQWVPFAHVAKELGAGAHPEWFAADRAWFSTVFERVRQAIQRD